MEIKDKLIRGGGWVKEVGVMVFNVYRAPNIITGNASKVGRWLDDFDRIYPEEHTHIIKDLASKVQHPEIKINHGQVWGETKGSARIRYWSLSGTGSENGISRK
jgi:hypothetical protein